MPSTDKKILIVGPERVDEMVTARALLVALKQQHPHCQIDLLASADVTAVAETMAEVDRVIVSPLEHDEFDLGRRHSLGLGLKEECYDQAVVLPGSFKSALIPFFAEIPLRTGWRGQMRFFLLNDIRLFSKRRYPLREQRYLALGYEPGAVLPEVILPDRG